MPNLIIYCDRYEFTDKSLSELNIFDRVCLLPSKYEIYADDEGIYKSLLTNVLAQPFISDNRLDYYIMNGLPYGVVYIHNINTADIKKTLEDFIDNKYDSIDDKDFINDYLNLMDKAINEYK